MVQLSDLRCVRSVLSEERPAHVLHSSYEMLAIGTPPVSFNFLLDMGSAQVPCTPYRIKPVCLRNDL